MTVLYQVWVPAVAVAHLIGLSLLVYSLEKVSGIVSKTASRISGTCSRRRRATPTDSSPYIDTRDIENGQVLFQSCLTSDDMLQLVSRVAGTICTCFAFSARQVVGGGSTNAVGRPLAKLTLLRSSCSRQGN